MVNLIGYHDSYFDFWIIHTVQFKFEYYLAPYILQASFGLKDMVLVLFVDPSTDQSLILLLKSLLRVMSSPRPSKPQGCHCQDTLVLNMGVIVRICMGHPQNWYSWACAHTRRPSTILATVQIDVMLDDLSVQLQQLHPTIGYPGSNSLLDKCIRPWTRLGYVSRVSGTNDLPSTGTRILKFGRKRSRPYLGRRKREHAWNIGNICVM